jgi:hypothetical protein
MREPRGDTAGPRAGDVSAGGARTAGKRTLTEALPAVAAPMTSPADQAQLGEAVAPAPPPVGVSAPRPRGIPLQALFGRPAAAFDATPSAASPLAVASGGRSGAGVVQRAPGAAAQTTGSPGSARAELAAPAPGIDKTGFIDNSDGANLRTGPAEAGGQLVRDQPLPPATRVFVSGTHPAASDWWYVTAFLGRTMLCGYVQGLRVNIDLPEPLARLHRVQPGETVEKLAAQEFGHAMRDGHDLRYYENVLLYVNRTHPPRSRPGIAGTYQEPGALGGGGNNIQLFAGNRIWLVHPEYARALESIVPSGSLTGGALAKARRFAGHVEDIVHSVTESRHHLDEVAGEFADAIREHLPRIVGIVAGFLVAELGSAALAATPTGVTQGLAVVIQLALSALGAANMVEAGVAALQHGGQWLTTAWTARGKAEQVTEASKEFLRMLVAVAIAALGYFGARGNYRNALKIARQMPPGGLPVPVTAGSGAGGGAATQSRVPISPSSGAIGAAGMEMSRHDGDAAETPKAPEGGKPSRAENEASKHGKGAGNSASEGSGLPDEAMALEAEAAETKGRGLPEWPIAKATIKPEVIETDARVLEYELVGKTSTGKKVEFGSVALELSPRGEPAKPPIMSLKASAFVDGTEYAAHIYDEIVIGAAGRPLGRGPRISLTRYVLDAFGEFYERRFGYPLKAWGGNLAFENKLHYQREYVRLIDKGVPPEVAVNEAAKRISYGRHRIEAGFSKLTVTPDPLVPVDLGPGFGIREVPPKVEIVAEKP